MTAEVIPDRRVTVPGRGFNPALVDGSRLYRALPSPVHEGFWFRAVRRTGYKVMRCLPHAVYGPVQDKRRRAAHCAILRSDRATLAPCLLPSRRGLLMPERF